MDRKHGLSVNKNFEIYIIDATNGRMDGIYRTGIRGYIDVMLEQAKTAISRLEGQYILATNDPAVAREYGLELRIGFQR